MTLSDRLAGMRYLDAIGTLARAVEALQARVQQLELLTPMGEADFPWDEVPPEDSYKSGPDGFVR